VSDSSASDFPTATPAPPYYAVIFASVRQPGEDVAYAETAARMGELAAGQPGFLGIESVRDADGQGLTVSYWADEASIAAWRQHAEHLVAQRHGRETWYSRFALRVAKVEAARTYERPVNDPPSAPTFAELAASRKGWIHGPLKDWCRRANRKNLLLAEQEWFDIAGKADPAKTLWTWAWSRFPDLVHADLGLNETTEVVVTVRDGTTHRGYPDARQSLAGRLKLLGTAGESPLLSIDDITAVNRVAD
jgi:heme-degrading monooxygenase HmoA